MEFSGSANVECIECITPDHLVEGFILEIQHSKSLRRFQDKWGYIKYYVV